MTEKSRRKEESKRDSESVRECETAHLTNSCREQRGRKEKECEEREEELKLE